MTKAELARRAGLSPLTLGRVEAGQSSRISTKRKLLRALNIPLTERGVIFPELV